MARYARGVATSKEPPNLEEAADGFESSLASEFFDFLKHNKKWWLLPLLVVVGAVGVLSALSSSGLAPFIYTLF